MEKKWNMRRAIPAVAAALLLAAAVNLLCRWVGYDLQEQVGNQLEYRIVNDEYSRVVEVPQDGLYQTLPVAAGERVYGVRLRFSTYGTLYRAGMVMVDVYDAEGSLVAQSAGNYENVFDDNFADFPFGSSYTAAEDGTLTLHIYNEVEWEGPLGLWASEGAVDGMPLALDAAGTPADATLAVQYITNDSGSWPAQLAALLRGPLTLAAFAAVMLLAATPAPLAAAVAVLALLLGSVFATVTPPLVGPDEYTHLAASYELASRFAGGPVADENGKLLVRAEDAPYFATKSGDIGIVAYQNMMEKRSTGGGADAALSAVSEADAGQGSGSYLAQAAGIWLARVRGVGFYNLLWYGRMANLLLYAVLAAAALLLAPRSVRGLLAAVALLPMPLQLAASLSPDATLLGLVLCFVALCLTLREKQGAAWQLVLLAVLMGCIAPSKAIYLPVVALVCCIPPAHLMAGWTPGAARRLPGHPGSWVKAGLLVLASGIWAWVNAKSLHYAARDMNFSLLALGGAVLAAAVAVLAVIFVKIYKNPVWRRRFWQVLAVAVAAAVPTGMFVLAHMGGGLTPEQLVEGIQPNGDSIYTYSFGYICRNLPATLKLLLRTLPEQGALWLQGVLGTTLGEPIVYRVDVSWVLGVGLLLALLAAALPVQGAATPLKLGRRCRWGLGAIVLAVVGISFVVALGWTPINYQTLFGLQGRYWLPVLPLALLLVKTNRSVAAARDAGRGAVLSIALMNVLVLLQGAGLYATWQLT